MTCSLTELKEEETALREALLAMAATAKEMRQTGKSAGLKEFWIGRTKVGFNSALDLAAGIRQTQQALKDVREQIRSINQSNSSITFEGGAF